MNNRWNEIIYKLWSPVYDRIFNTGKFLEARQKLFLHPPFHPQQRILFVGVGTGADLELLDHTQFHITAIDYS
ncbi:SAM-dependent methyltransferase, partial [Rossellomorea vietnamensis]